MKAVLVLLVFACQSFAMGFTQLYCGKDLNRNGVAGFETFYQDGTINVLHPTICDDGFARPLFATSGVAQLFCDKLNHRKLVSFEKTVFVEDEHVQSHMIISVKCK